MIHSFHANGKLLLTAEYFVLDGALALALPVNRGQNLHIHQDNSTDHLLHWQSYTLGGELWFEGYFELKNMHCTRSTDEAVGSKLSEIFQYIRLQKPDFLQQVGAINARTQLRFPRTWGLGTSSTLIANIAEWAKVDPFDLQFAAFGGSGYDIACAKTQHPILYRKTPTIQFETVDFKPPFKDNLYFVYLGKKQNSRTGIAHYRERVKAAPQLIEEVSALTKACLVAPDLASFEQVLRTHEDLIAKNLQMQPAKMLYFSDFWGSVKSLGAWGGDFVLVTSNRSEAETKSYFQTRGFDTFFRYDDFTIF